MSEEAIQDTGSQEVASQAVAESAVEEVSFRDSLPEDLRTAPGMLKFKDVPGLAQGYVNLESMVGTDKIGLPQQSWTDSQWSDFYAKTGRPESFDEYSVDLQNVLSDEDSAAFRQAAFEAGLAPRQVERLTKYLNETSSKVQQGMETTSQEAYDVGIAQLQQEYGQAFDQRVKVSQNAAKTLLGEDGMQMFEAPMADGRLLGDYPEIIKMFAVLGEQMGEDKLIGETSELIMTPEQAKQELKDLMRPGTPYTDGGHPEHDAYVRKVEDLFKASS
tara:strand:- start:136 stop:957 length:822 start_codon:yes stop_codon:yes gene_type:complete